MMNPISMAHRAHPPSLWTSKRLIAHGTILALCVWSIYVWNVATPGLHDRNGNLKGTDFLHFYVLGSVAIQNRGADLYDMNAQGALAAQRVPEAAGIQYLPLYPPQVSIFFAPLAHLSYFRALVSWWGFSTALYGLCCYAVWRACPNLHVYPGIILLLAVSFPAFFHLIGWGQTSAVALACFTLMFFFLRDRRDFLVGLALGSLIFKPQLALTAAVVFASVGTWKILAGAAVSAGAQLSTGIFYYGMEPLLHWVRLLRNVSSALPLLEPKLYQTHCLRTFWSMLVPWPVLSFVLYAASALALLGLTILVSKRGSAVPLALRFSALLLTTVLVAPHLTVYDLVILAPVFLLLADWLVGQPSTPSTRMLRNLLYLVYMLPLLGPLVRWTHIQLSVVSMAATVYVIWQLSHPASGAPTSPDTNKEKVLSTG
jgi:hypothetical protein